VPPDTATRLTAWGALLHVQGDEDVQQERVCELLEVEIIALALKWKWSSDPLAILQQLTYESMRKHDTMHNNHSDHDTRLTRRRALQTIALLPIQMYGLTLFAPEAPSRLPLDELLPCCASGMIGLWEHLQYAPEGMAAIGRMLPLYLSTLERIARQSPPPFQQAAARLAAQGYLLVTKLATHYRRLDQMEAASLLARSYGQLAHDPNLEVAALIRLAVKYSNERRMVEAFNTYQEAAALPGFASASPLLRGDVYGALAATGAFCHNPEALSFLSQAKDVYPMKPEADPGFVFTLDGKDTLSLWEGLTLKRTGHHAEAVTAFSRFGSLTPVPGLLDYRRAEHLNYAASVAIEQRELDTAYLYLDTAEEVAQNIQHKQRQAEVRETFRDMQLLWPHEPKIKTLQEKIYARQH
jgi:tetratricopeptide (TPR) repeat protein